MKRNEVINYPIQGSAFHCLLWSLTQLVLKHLKKHKMKSIIIGQIHDSIIADVPEEETDDYIALANRVMVDSVRRKWDWIITPLETEAAISSVNGNWADTKEYKSVQ